MVRPEEGEDVVHITFSFFAFYSKPFPYVLSLEKRVSPFHFAVCNRHGAKELVCSTQLCLALLTA